MLSVIFKLTKWSLMIVGLGTIVSFVFTHFIYDALGTVQVELSSREDVKAYQFDSYEGRNYGFEIWLKNGGYIRTTDIGKEDFKKTSFKPIYQIGGYELKCYSQERGQKNEYGELILFGRISSLNVALNGDYDANLHDLISNYAAIEDMVSAWPDTEEAALTFTLDISKYPDAAPDAKLYPRVCWREEMQQPRVPRVQKDTVFYHAPYKGGRSKAKEREE